MVKGAGMKLSVTCIAGLGSLELSEEHAIKTAEALSRMKPEYIGLLTLLFELETPLMRDWQEGRFYLMNPIEIAHETLILLEHIDSEGSIFRANHASNYVNLAARSTATARPCASACVRRSRGKSSSATKRSGQDDQKRNLNIGDYGKKVMNLCFFCYNFEKSKTSKENCDILFSISGLDIVEPRC